MHNKKHQAYSLSQNDYPNILFISGKAAWAASSRIERFVSSTQAPSFNLQYSIVERHSLLVLLLSM